MTRAAGPTMAGVVGMQPSDAFFWYAEAATPQLRPLVAGLFLLDRTPHRARFRTAVERLTVQMPRLRQRVADPPFGVGLPVWRTDDEFELDYHLRQVVLPQPATHRQLLHYAGELFSTPIDHLRPLWEAHLIGGLADGCAALFLKMHHAVMDGVGSVALFDALTTARRGDPVVMPRRRAPADNRTAAGIPWTTAVGRTLADPLAALRQAARLARGAGGVLADIAATGGAAATNGQGFGVGRRLDGIAFSLPRLRRIKSALDVTLNDLVLVAVSGAVGRYRAHAGLPLDALPCMVPMNLRQEHERTHLGNRVGSFTVFLPVGERDPLARLERIRAQTQHAKRAGHGAASQLLMQAVALVPAAVFRTLTARAAGRVQLICSNVPGPPAFRYLAGAKIETVYPFAPVMFGTPAAIALVSYGPTIGVGIATDPAVIPDPERLGRYLEREMDDIERRVAGRRRAAVPSAARGNTARRSPGVPAE